MSEQSAATSSAKSLYGYKRMLEISYDEAITRIKETLKTEGFGVLCEIDIKEKLKEKLGVDFCNYIILGACNPPIAYQALQEEIDLGLLLPCNVIVYEEQEGETIVAAIDVAKMLSIVENPKLETAAETVNEKLRRAIDSL
jgi:uncharacterized protein (DUF302 family)